jgi:outer membrane receptor protein involved in Fe transport
VTARTVSMALVMQGFQIEVLDATPLPGVDLSPGQVAAPVKAGTLRELEESGALDLSDFLNRRLNGVHLNDLQGNPFQADLNYRGYTASPLLGTPQGVSIYMDGVRLNQPFGDVVSWDLIPRIAISETTLMPGSDPLFGLNTLGGAVLLRTKDGVSQAGTALQIGGGSFGRKTADIERGGVLRKGWNYYLASSFLVEDGWRVSSPSNVRQFFGKAGWQGTRTAVSASLVFANNALIGNGLQEQRFVTPGYSGVYTKPDITANRSPFLNLSMHHTVASSVTVSGNFYYRYIRTNTLNGDINEDSFDQAVYQPSAADIRALTAAGYSGFPTSGATAANTPYPFWRCLAQALQLDEPAEKCTGILNRTHAQQHNYGGGVQLTWHSVFRGSHNQLTIGAALDHSTLSFQQTSQLGYVSPDLSVVGVNAFGDGVNGGMVDGEPFDTRVDLDGRIHTASIYATDTLTLGRSWNFTVSGRYNRTTIRNRDQIRSGVVGSLDGDAVFGRFNPAAGVTYSPVALLNVYFGYSEGSRAPTSVELGCADEQRPCKLPNAMTSDPPLDQVVTRTLEAGVRGGSEKRLNWSAGWFHAQNHNDILFVASTRTGFGYFKNFGRTRRQGMEWDIGARAGRASFGGGYTYLEATYQTAEIVNGSGNSSNDSALRGAKGLAGNIAIRPGDHMPLIPTHMGKAFVDVQATRALTVDLSMVAVSGSIARGNENNLHQADGVYYLGPGRAGGYAVFHGGARYQLMRRVQLFVQVNNLLDRHYFTGAQLGATGFNAQHTINARPLPAVNGEFPVIHATFYAPGAPRGAWGGMRIRF